ncbi:hypothetical protein BGZ92_008271 [Podila epicladia]|nr:hypothetical protein BGZ92_008271 [Podila epicladia]
MPHHIRPATSVSDPLASSPHLAEQDAILVTGGAGFIGSHTVVQLLSLGLRLVIVDNLCNSSEEAMHRALELAGNKGELFFHKVDLLDGAALEKVFELYTFSACIHFAGLKAVGESSQIPIGYYQTNVTGTLNLLQLLQRHNCRNFIFSSSATVYGLPSSTDPIREDASLGALNPYGRTKQYIEEILRDIANSEPNQWNIIMLRYFNPVGAHESGRIGEDPNGIPNNLMPFVAQVAIGRRPVINVFGNDYETPDGTGVRDYIHIVDLARGHVAALKKIQSFSMGAHTSVHNNNGTKSLGCVPYNLGSGIGYSVMDMIESMSKAVVALCVADPTLSAHDLDWRAEKTLQDMCNDLWRWQIQNPNGYEARVAKTASGTEEEDEEEGVLREDSDVASVASTSSASLPETSPSTPTPGELAPSVFASLPVTLLPIISTIAKPAPVMISAESLKAVKAATPLVKPVAATQVPVVSPAGSPAPGATAC